MKKQIMKNRRTLFLKKEKTPEIVPKEVANKEATDKEVNDATLNLDPDENSWRSRG